MYCQSGTSVFQCLQRIVSSLLLRVVYCQLQSIKNFLSARLHDLNASRDQIIPHLKLSGNLREYSPISKTARVAKKILRIINTKASICGENMLVHLSLGIICSSKLTVFLELRSRKTVRFSEQVMSADKYSSTFSRQLEAIAYVNCNYKCRSYSKRND